MKGVSDVRNAKYKTIATPSGGGRDGRTALAHGTMSLDPVVPKELGGPCGDGANSESLFALGHSACFLPAMRNVSSRTKIKRPEGSTVTATIGIGPRFDGGFGITAELDVYLPASPEADARQLVYASHGGSSQTVEQVSGRDCSR
jgi:osmotically inducible protein OsmC